MSSNYMTSNLKLLSDAESTTNWVDDAKSWTQNDEVAKIGAYCNGFDMDIEVKDSSYFNVSGAFAGPIDVSNWSLYWWFMLLGAPDAIATQASGGIRLGVYDRDGNTGWYYFGREDYIGGWQRFGVDLSQPFTTGSTNRALCYRVYFGGQGYSKSKLTENYLVDQVHYFEQTGAYDACIEISGGSDGSEINWDDIVTANEASGEGIVIKQGGAYYLNGPIQIGDSEGTGDTIFRDANQIVFANEMVADPDYLAVYVKGNGTGTTKVIQGSNVGGVGIQGCTWKSLDDEAWLRIVATDSNIDEFGLWGSIIQNHGSVYLPDIGEIVSTSFIGGKEVEVNKALVKYASFIDTSEAAFAIFSTGHRVGATDIINCPTGIRFTTSGTYSLSGVIFTGNTVDVRNDDIGSITIGALAGSNPATSSGDFVIQNFVSITVNCQTLGGVPISEARVAIYSTGVISATGASEYDTFMNEKTNPAGVATESFNYAGDRDITIRIRKSHPAASGYDGVDYFPYTTAGQISAGGYSLTAVLNPDTTAT